MGRHKARKPRRERSTPAIEAIESSTRILFDSSDPRIEVFRRVKAQLQANIEPDPEDLRILWEWHQEDPMTA